MEDKVLELLEKLSGEIDEIKANMATKDDIANMATKDDIANMATKDDIANMATKDDIANMATKDDIKLLADELHMEIQTVLDEVKDLRQDFNAMEVMTTKNAFDIAKLKSIR